MALKKLLMVYPYLCQMLEPDILYEDNHLLVLNKPSGWLVQGDRTGDRTLTDWARDYIKVKYDKPGAVYLHPAHRIDRPVSGAVIFGRTDKALSRLQDLFGKNMISKTYLALVHQPPREKSGRLTHYLIKNEQNNTVTAHKILRAGAKESITDFTYLGGNQWSHLLKVHPVTGRPHQIRVQLSAIGSPILGDLKYGAATALPDASIALHCFEMSFIHPVQKTPIYICAPLNKEKSHWKDALYWM